MDYWRKTAELVIAAAQKQGRSFQATWAKLFDAFYEETGIDIFSVQETGYFEDTCTAAQSIRCERRLYRTAAKLYGEYR
jgi:hypothetical protein